MSIPTRRHEVIVKKIFSQDYGRPLPLTYGHRRHLQKS